MKSPNQHVFSLVPHADIPRSRFRTQFSYKTAFDSGLLVPFFVQEALPGDSLKLDLTAFARLSTPVVPVMDNLYMDFQFFAVPCRLVWDHFVNMMGERPNPDDSIDYLVPMLNSGESGVSVGSIFDYMGIPPNVANLEFSSLWPRAYNLIWNEWYRDENLQDRVPQNHGDLSDALTDYTLLPRGKRKNYFDGALPWPQKGDAALVPIGDVAPVVGNGVPYFRASSGESVPVAFAPSSSSTSSSSYASLGRGVNLDGNVGEGYVVNEPIMWDGENTGLYADLSSATGATINSLRQAFQLQKLLERDALGGTRYCSLLVSHFGVTSPDSRLQRPEYLGGGTIPIQIHSVTQTSGTTSGSTPQGNLAAIGVSGGHVGFRKSFVEHTLLLGLVSVRADITYQQGLHRMWSRRGRYDFYWPVLSHLGEQAILNKEIYAQGASVVDVLTGEPVDEGVFAYQERWAEYRYGQSMITGKLRSGVSGSLDVWHFGRYFEELPVLNGNYIQDKPPIKRCLAVQDEPEIIFDSLVSADWVRPMPLYSVPGLIDHF